MRDFRKLEIWKKGLTLVKEIYQVMNKMSNEEKYGMVSQIKRASISVPSNIAEGCSRNSEIEFKRFLEISMGSLFELETQFLLCAELKLLKTQDVEPIILLIEEEEKMINKLISKIKKEKLISF